MYDVAILGAGPAGTTCALALHAAGVRVVLLDKDTFPRDKICGDAIPGRSFKVMRSIRPEWEEELFALRQRATIRSARVVAPNLKDFTLDWEQRAYNSPRLDFDNHLFGMVGRHTDTEIRQGFYARGIERTAEGITLTATDGTSVSAKLLIACDGANSVVARKLDPQPLDRRHHAAAVRAYVRGVRGLREDTNEVITVEKFLPGYLWIFPVGEGLANVGFGMLSERVKATGMNLRAALLEVIHEHPDFRDRFAGAEIVGEVTGFGLPFGSQLRPLAGNRYLLAGDAGALIDPMAGHGIDKAMLSGKMAAGWAARALAADRYEADFLRGYEREVYAALAGEFRRNHLAMRFLAGKPWLINWGVGLARNDTLKGLLRKVAY